MASVLGQLFRLDSDVPGIAILRLASLPGEVVDAVVCLSARLAFEFSLWSEGGIPLLLMCEEAHRYAAADHSVGFAPTRRALSRIAKEGRKHGVSLGLVTQRPAELDPTIVSQCSTLFVMRMTNGDDQAILRSATSEAAANLLAFVPSLATGEVVGIGEAMPVPARFTFNTLPHELLPYSEWRTRLTDSPRDLSRAELIRKAIERWRRATTNQTRFEENAGKGEPSTGERDGTSALARGLNALAGEGLSLDTERYTTLKR
jgi:DNA helicase HerA-like ATPase